MDTGKDSFEPRFRDFDSFTSERKEFPPYNNFHGYFWDKDDMFAMSHVLSEIAPTFHNDHQNLGPALVEMVTRLYGKDDEASLREWIQDVEPLLFIAHQIIEASERVQALLRNESDLLIS